MSSNEYRMCIFCLNQCLKNAMYSVYNPKIANTVYICTGCDQKYNVMQFLKDRQIECEHNDEYIKSIPIGIYKANYEECILNFNDICYNCGKVVKDYKVLYQYRGMYFPNVKSEEDNAGE